MRIKKANLLKLGQYQICLEHFEKFRALDSNPRHKPTKVVFRTGLLFVKKTVEGAIHPMQNEKGLVATHAKTRLVGPCSVHSW